MKHYLSEVRDVLESVDATQDGLKSAEAGERLQKTVRTSFGSLKKFLCLSGFSNSLPTR